MKLALHPFVILLLLTTLSPAPASTALWGIVTVTPVGPGGSSKLAPNSELKRLLLPQCVAP